MDRFMRKFRRRPLEGIMEESSKESLGSETAAEAAVVPDGYKLIEFQQPDGTVIAVRRKISTWQLAHRDSLTSSRPPSSTASFKTVVSRTSDGRLVCVQRPVRDLAPPSGTTSRLSQVRSGGTRISGSSSVYSANSGRDTMRSTMTAVDAALADQLSTQIKRHSRRDGSATTTASGTAISGTSGDIHIGHIEEVDEYDNAFEYALNDYAERQDHRWEGGQFGYQAARSGSRNSQGSCAPLEPRGLPQYELPSLDIKDFPSPPSTAYFPEEDTMSWGSTAKLRAKERRAFRRLQPSKSRKRAAITRLIRGISYIMAGCSIVLPALFLVLGIVVASMNGKTLSPARSAMASIVDIAAAIWPVVFAAVAAQGFKTWYSVKAGRWNTDCGQVTEPRKLAQHFEALCLLVFLVWCLSPLGSQALQRSYRFTTETRQTSTDAWYVDRTGYNSLWSANSTLSTSAANRSELVQITSEKYISSLASSNMLSDETEATTGYSLPAPSLSDSNDSTSGPKNSLTSSSSLLSLRDINGTSGLDPTAQLAAKTWSFSMITSHFELTCDNWSLTLRNVTNTTFATNMSYSESQTLGLSMSNGDDSTRPMSSLTFASLNKITDGNDTTLETTGGSGTSPRNGTWEYSSIQCGFKQYFYSKPVRCERGQSISSGTCVQSAQQGLILSPVGLSGTELGDFAHEFASANLPTAEGNATATESYVQHGGFVDPTSLTVKRDGSLPLNLSATVSPEEFAQNFGYLFNMWVSLGYCPQCTSDVLAGNNTVIPADVQPFYRRATATTMGFGARVFTVNWAWIAVFLAFAASMLIAGVTSVAIEYIVRIRSACRRKGASIRGIGDQPYELSLVKTYCT